MDRQFKLLIVDDDKISLKLMRDILVRSNPRYAIYESFDPEEALGLLKQEPFDLILLDVVMPRMDGYEVCRQVKQLPSYRDIPVIFITGLGKTDEKVEGFKAGAVDYIVKPVDAEEMKMRVNTHLKIKEYQDQLKEANDIILRTQAALVNNAKMSAVGTLTTGIAHEFNNILFMMRGYTEIADWHQEKDDLHKSLKVIEGLVDRGTRIVKKLNEFCRKDELLVKEDVDLRQVLEEDIRLLRKRFETCHVQCRLEADRLEVFKGYPSQLSQLFINLVRNAIDAMKDSPEKIITIQTRLCCQGTGLCKTDPSVSCQQGKRCALVSVRDTGCGIPDQVKNKIFEPFVTTKGVLGGGDSSMPGMGLGLSICYGIVKRHNGAITYLTELGKGTEFTIAIPIES